MEATPWKCGATQQWTQHAKHLKRKVLSQTCIFIFCPQLSVKYSEHSWPFKGSFYFCDVIFVSFNLKRWRFAMNWTLNLIWDDNNDNRGIRNVIAPAQVTWDFVSHLCPTPVDSWHDFDHSRKADAIILITASSSSRTDFHESITISFQFHTLMQLQVHDHEVIDKILSISLNVPLQRIIHNSRHQRPLKRKDYSLSLFTSRLFIYKCNWNY